MTKYHVVCKVGSWMESGVYAGIEGPWSSGEGGAMAAEGPWYDSGWPVMFCVTLTEWLHPPVTQFTLNKQNSGFKNVFHKHFTEDPGSSAATERAEHLSI